MYVRTHRVKSGEIGGPRDWGRGGSVRILLMAMLCACRSTWAIQPDVMTVPPADTSTLPARTPPAKLPPAAGGVKRLLEAAYLSPEAAADKRVAFGRWTLADLDSPARMARAALMRGSYDDPSFDDPSVDPLDRAEAKLELGKAAEALTILDERTQRPNIQPSTRADRLRVDALAMAGETDQAVELATARIKDLLARPITDASTAVEAVRLVTARVRLAGPLSGGAAGPAAAAAEYQGLMTTLGEVRAGIDRLSWETLLVEAELLYAKDNRDAAREAATEALSINPSVARAWALLGRLGVDSFNFDFTERAAARLNVLAGDRYAPGDENFDEDQAPLGISPHASALIARAMLRQIDGAEADAALAPALSRFPARPELLGLSAAAAALRFDDAALKAALEKSDQLLGKHHPGAYHAVGKALAEARQYDAAAQALDEAHKRSPYDPEPLIDRGLLEVQAGRDELARAALEQSFALDPFNVRADNSLRLVRELATYDRIETPNFIIRFKPRPTGTPSPDAILAREMPAILERNHALVTGPEPGSIDHTLAKDQRTIIDLMPDHQWFAVRIAGMPRIHTIAASTGPVIAMESPREGPGSTGTYDWSRVLRHEYVHTITLSRTKSRIPHWFTEASAVYLERSPRDWSTVQMLARAVDTGTLFDFSYLNLAFVRPKKPADRGMAYSQGEWMYSFMVERYGHRAPLELMDQYAQGVREEAAFEFVLKRTRKAFFEEFKTWAREELVRWGMLPPSGAPTISELLKRDTGQAKSPEAQAALDAALDSDEGPAGPSPEQIARWLEQYPTHPDVLELAVDQALSAEKGLATPASAPMLLRYAAARPVDPKPHRRLAKMYLDAAKRDPARLAADAALAIPHLEFLDAREQKSPEYAMELARRHAALGAFEAGYAKADRATQIAPFLAGARELAATTAIQGKRWTEARRHLEALAAIEPDRPLHQQRLEALGRLAPADGAKSP
jgi:cellulose synthase operon protein C